MVNHFEDQSIEIVNYPKGKTLFRQGDPGDAAYIVNAGSVGIYREFGDKKLPLATLRRGELFGEMAVIDGSPRMATAFTLEDSTLMVITVDMMAEKMRKTDPFMKALIHMLLNNLRSVHDTYTPKARSLFDAVNNLGRQCDALTRFLSEKDDEDLDVDLAVKVGELNELVQTLRNLAVAHRAKDPRSDALPPEIPPG